jgi:hypothetical protein
LLSSHAAAGATVAWNTPGDWAALLRTTEVGGIPVMTIPTLVTSLLTTVVTAMTGLTGLVNQDAYLVGNTPGAGGLDTYCRLFESNGTGAKMRLYYGNGSFWVTFNARWFQGSPSKWVYDVATKHAMAVGIGYIANDPSLMVNKQFTSNFGTGWTVWDATLAYGTAYMADPDPDVDAYVNNAPIATTNYIDVCKWALAVDGPSSSATWDYCAVTAHAYAFVVPNFAFVTVDYETPGQWTDIEFVAGTADAYGLIVRGRADVDGWSGTVIAYGRVAFGNA